MPKEDTQFKVGGPGGPGRKKGSRNKLGEQFLKDVYQLWLERGNQALLDMLAESPTKFCQMVSLTLPKHIDLESNDTRWVINAYSYDTELEWRKAHGLPLDT